MTDKLQFRIDVQNKDVADDIQEAIQDGIKDSVGLTAKNSLNDEIVDAAKQKIREHERVWRGDLLESFDVSTQRMGKSSYVVTIENDEEYARTTEYGRTPGEEKPPLAALIPWVKTHLDDWDVDPDFYDDGGGGSGQDEVYVNDDEDFMSYAHDDGGTLANMEAYESWDSEHGKMIIREAEEMGISRAEYKQGLRNEYERLTDESSTDVVQRVPFDNFENILEDGRLKTQYETESSMGTYNPSYRKKFERLWGGYDESAPDDKRPIYGYLKPTDKRVEGARQYGDVILEYDDRIRDATTFVVGDSFDSNASNATDLWNRGPARSLPTWLNSPGYRAKAIDGFGMTTTLEDLRNMEDVADVRKYVETQIHHGYAKLGNVKRVVFTNDEPTEKMKNLLEDWGIPWSVEE